MNQQGQGHGVFIADSFEPVPKENRLLFTLGSVVTAGHPRLRGTLQPARGAPSCGHLPNRFLPRGHSALSPVQRYPGDLWEL